MNTHIVVKPFELAKGRRLESGQEVDASNWRNTDNLVKHRYLKPIPQHKQHGDMRQQNHKR